MGKGRILALGFPIARSPGAMEVVLEEWAGVRRYATTDVPESDASVGLAPGRNPVAILYTLFAGENWNAPPYPAMGHDPTADEFRVCEL